MKFFVLSSFLALVSDLFSKFYAKENLSGEKINLIGDWIYLTYIENPGIAFGVGVPPLLLKIGTILLILALFFYYFAYDRKDNGVYGHIGYGLIFGGALGNAYERIFNEKVIDFIGVSGFSIFNLADAFISIGVAILIIINLKKK